MQPLEPDDPQDLGDYRLLGRLGAGGMGRVYLGRTPGGRTVAVKAVRPDLARDAEFRERFRQEVAAARRVGGAWTAPVLDTDTEGPQPWVATGFVAGPSLAAAVNEHGALPEPTTRLLGVGLAEALAHVHALGLVHRDVKPSNVLLTLDGPRLIDFGIARALDASTGFTRTGHVVGSPGFMSPEQAQGQPAGPASDMFSLGAVLALAASGRPPFGDGVSGAVLLYRVLHEQPDLSTLDYPLRAAILACMAKNPEARPTPQQLRERLDPDASAAGRLGSSSWLPADLAASVGRTAVRLLDLETDGPAPVPTPPAPLSGHRTHDTVTTPPPPPGFGPPAPGAYGPAEPLPYGPPAPPPAPRRRGRPIAGITVGTLLVAAAVGYGITRLDRSGGTSGAKATSSAGAAPPGSATPGSDKATDRASDPPASKSPSGDPEANGDRAAFIGIWGAQVGRTDAVTVTVHNTRVNDPNAAEGYVITAGGHCDAAWTLTSASTTKLRFTSRLIESKGVKCSAAGQRELELLPDGTLRYTMIDGGTTVDSLVLTKAPPGISG
ncbi:serine/threonine-protein kinase [Kitasatospora sp. NPDC085879]|uniref:serine/threonine-protein kinase n=1 Tax=Kitasatospora sp. NPDC085879 TaxID=3154769 RepID=UPI0034488036